MTMRGSDVLAVWRARHRRSPRERARGGKSRGTYTVAANAVLTAGRRFGAFGGGWGAERIGTDLEALVAWLGRGER
jgi:hypothetical protein